MTRGLLPPDPRSLCPQLNLLDAPPLPRNKIPGYATVFHQILFNEKYEVVLNMRCKIQGC